MVGVKVGFLLYVNHTIKFYMGEMKILIACEYSGRVRDAFIKKGHNAMSCDILQTDSPGLHYKGDVFDLIGNGWDMIIAFPPCTHLCSSGARWWKQKIKDGRQSDAIKFFLSFTSNICDRIAIENPIGIMSTQYRKPDQIIHPWQFGHGETKATCLWLKGLPKLKPTNIVEGREQKIHRMSSSWSKQRSLTYQGIADAMANQWG